MLLCTVYGFVKTSQFYLTPAPEAVLRLLNILAVLNKDFLSSPGQLNECATQSVVFSSKGRTKANDFFLSFFFFWHSNLC